MSPAVRWLCLPLFSWHYRRRKCSFDIVFKTLAWGMKTSVRTHIYFSFSTEKQKQKTTGLQPNTWQIYLLLLHCTTLHFYCINILITCTLLSSTFLWQLEETGRCISILVRNVSQWIYCENISWVNIDGNVTNCWTFLLLGIPEFSVPQSLRQICMFPGAECKQF